MVKRGEIGNFGRACWQCTGHGEQDCWLAGSSWAWRAVEMQELSAEEAVVASHAPPQMGILTVLPQRVQTAQVEAARRDGEGGGAAGQRQRRQRRHDARQREREIARAPAASPDRSG